MLLSDKQRQVVECYESNCLAVACPGSGKTRVLVSKVEHIIKHDPGARILITSFTKDSAAEIRKRIVAKIGSEAARRVASGTFHSISLHQLQQADDKFNPTIISSGQMKQYIQRALNECKLFDFDLDEACSLIETAKLTPDFEPSNDDHGRLFVAYTALTERNNVIDFADMLSRTVRQMRSGEMPPKDCQYLMTDESQDLDEMQYAWCSEHIKKGSIFTVVGDDDQSIYKFRRALGYEGMMRFKKDFGATLITLDSNFRSHSEILTAAGSVIVNNAPNRVDKKLFAERGTGGRVEAWHCLETEHETNFVIGKILTACESNPNPKPDEYLVGVSEGEWAVLARNNNNLSELAMAMVAYGIPHLYKGKNLWSESPVCLVIGLLSSLTTGAKAGFDSALYFAGMDEGILTRLHQDFGDDFSQMFYGSPKFEGYGKGTASNLKKFSAKVPQWGKSLSKGRVSIVVRGVFDWFIERLDKGREDNKSNGSYNVDLKRLNAAKSILAGMDGDLPSRIKRVTRKPDSTNKKGVYLGTLHSSKGLEYKNVWLLQMDEDLMPSSKEDWTQEIHEEERRLFYVGLTRAENSLFISCTNKPSSYIQETGIKLVSIFDDTDDAPKVDTQRFQDKN